MYSVYIIESGNSRLVLESDKALQYVYDYALDHYLLYGIHGYIVCNINNVIVKRF